jgi:hypothetical protein
MTDKSPTKMKGKKLETDPYVFYLSKPSINRLV